MTIYLEYTEKAVEQELIMKKTNEKPDVKLIVTVNQLPVMSGFYKDKCINNKINHHIINHIYREAEAMLRNTKMFHTYMDMNQQIPISDRTFIPLDLWTSFREDMQIWLEGRWWIENEN